jgi:hypothetical protein
VLMGAYSKWVPKRIAEYCDGWFPIDLPGISLAGQLDQIRSAMKDAGRSFERLDLSIQVFAGASPNNLRKRIPALLELGFGRIVFLIPQTRPADQWPGVRERRRTRSGVRLKREPRRSPGDVAVPGSERYRLSSSTAWRIAFKIKRKCRGAVTRPSRLTCDSTFSSRGFT